MKNIVVLISGRGSNCLALLETAYKHDWLSRFNARIVAVISNRPNAVGLESVRQWHVAQASIAYEMPSIEVVDHQAFANRADFDQALSECIDRYEPSFVVLAGFMRVLSAAFVEHYAGRLINIHPSLLPMFPGLRTHERALEAGVKWHGATVHFVTPTVDHGPIIAQAAVPVLPDDTPSVLAERVLQQEHHLLPQTVEWAIQGHIHVNNEGVAKHVHNLCQSFISLNSLHETQ